VKNILSFIYLYFPHFAESDCIVCKRIVLKRTLANRLEKISENGRESTFPFLSVLKFKNESEFKQ